MKLRSVTGNSQRLDGGAMFGNAPKVLWQRWVEVGDDNTIPLATRALLVQEDSGRNVLFEAGIGTFFEPDMRARYGVVEEADVLTDNLAAIGLASHDIDVVVLSHLHFDHAGGILKPWSADRGLELAFDSSRFVVSAAALERAHNPTVRDRVSFIPGLPGLLEETRRVEVVDGDRSGTLGDGYRFHFSQGHTPGLMLTEVEAEDGPVVFTGDLAPATPWVHVPITMGYDRYPELLVEEKAALWEDLEPRGARLFFVHDPDVAMAALERSDNGRYTTRDPVAVLDT